MVLRAQKLEAQAKNELTAVVRQDPDYLPAKQALADKGWKQALSDDPHLRAGLNVADGKVTYKAVAEAHGMEWTRAETVAARA